ncbi:MAG: DMT family transporter [Anaerolineae bacterium]|nr:DMT family transporter [Anaerolineae bacterium]
MMSRERVTAIAQTIFVLILQSLNTILVKMSIGTISVWALVWVPILVAIIAMGVYTFVIRRERIPRMSKKVWFYIIVIGVGNFAISRLLRPLELERMDATTNSYLVNFVGFMTMGLSIFILREPPFVFQLIGALLAVGGLRVFYQEAPPASEQIGILLVFIAIVAIAITNNVARKLSQITNNELSNNVISTLALMIGGGIAIAISLALDWPPRIVGIGNWGILVYSGIISIAVGLTVWNFILRTLRSYEASILGATTIIWTAMLAIPILGESLDINKIIGMAMMLAGIALVQVRIGRMDHLFGIKKQDTALAEGEVWKE